jgi:hypothetical protein
VVSRQWRFGQILLKTPAQRFNLHRVRNPMKVLPHVGKSSNRHKATYEKTEGSLRLCLQISDNQVIFAVLAFLGGFSAL